MLSANPLIARAWELCCLDPLQAAELGRSAAAEGGSQAHEGWLQVALAEVRVGDAAQASAALQSARRGFAERADANGLALCDEVQAVVLRRAGETIRSAQLQAAIDARPGLQPSAIHRFMAHNSRAITAKLLGQHDEALRQFYAALDSAARTGWPGPHITALSNLGAHHQDLYNLDDARRLTEQALAAAREAGARQMIATAATNLVIIHHASGEFLRARAMVEFLSTHTADLAPGMLQRHAVVLAMGHLGVGEIDAALRHLEGGAITAAADGDGITQWAWLTARCLLAKGDADGARRLAENTLQQRQALRLADPPYVTMALHRVLADACEIKGDSVAALRYMRQTHSLYEHLVGRSARARYTALQVAHELGQAQRERDLAMDGRRTVEDDRRRLSELNAALQAQAAETEMLHTKLREQALRDPLTGLHNRRYLFEMAPGLLDLTRRQNSTLCVVLMDLDHFKLLNDTYGHHAGDLVLQRFSTLMTQMLRRSDLVCRHGGEEFVAVMPDIDSDGADAVISRLLEAFQSQQTEMGKRRLPRGSFSAGIAVFPRNGHTLEQLLSRADRGLYSAKNQGRARIELAPGTGFGTLI